MKKLIFSIILLLLIVNVSADILSIGSSGEKEIVIGKGNEVDTFFSGNLPVSAGISGGGGGFIELGGVPITENQFYICLISFLLFIIFLVILVLVYVYEKKKRKF